MKIKLQKNKSEKNRVNKSVSLIEELNGTFRDSSSIINPIIIIETTHENITECNYITIPQFKRSYFITNVEVVRNNIYIIHLHCDVISSFKDELLKCKGIIIKNENEYNLYIDDGTLQTYNNPIILTKEFSGGFSSPHYVLAVAGS